MPEQQVAAQPTHRNQKAVLIIAIALGLTAAALNWIYVGQAARKSITVLKVKGPRSISAGTPVTREMFKEVVITGDVAEMKDIVVDADSFAAVNQQPVAETLKPGYILMTRAFKVTEEGGLRDSIAPNQLALSLNIDQEVQAVGYHVRPGVMVEVWGDVGVDSIPIVKNVCVKAVGDAYIIPGENAREGRYRSVTIFVPNAEEEVKNLLSNVILAGNKVRLLMKNEPCTASVEAVISPKHILRPEPRAALKRPPVPTTDDTEQAEQ